MRAKMWRIWPERQVSMPTLEEKITVLEENLTILLGIASGQEREIKSIQVGVMSLDRRFDALEGRLYGMDHRLSALERRFEVQDQKLDQILLLLNTYIPKPDQET
jgi:hypothetical protein